MDVVSTRQLINLLKSKSGRALGSVDRLKQVYRPMICPFDTLLNLIPNHQRVLDIGCGIGTFLQLVAEYRSPAALAGIDTNHSSIETSRALLHRFFPDTVTHLEAYNGVTLPAWIREYDYVVLIDVLHHIPLNRHASFLTQLFNGMRPGSMLVVKDIDADQRFWCLFNKIHDLLISGEHTHERGASQLRTALDDIGYKVRRTMAQRLYVYPHFTIVCEKP